MSLQLERDSRTHVQSHLDELTSRVTLVFALIAATTLLFSTQIDGWLDALLAAIDPCETECLNLYDPARWSAVRWLSSTLAATLACMPILLHQAWSFSNKGLLPSERSWMVRWMMGGTIASIVIIALTLLWSLPFVFDSGHTIQTNMGLVARYDAVLMLSISVAVIWTQMVVTVAILGMAIAGQLGVLNAQTADWWRIRCYGLVLMLLYASLPEFGSLAFLLMLGSVFSIETVCKSWLRQTAPQVLNSVTVMDEEGGARRPVLIECQCSGAAVPLPSPIDLNMPNLVYHSLCTSSSEREQVYDALRASRTTDAFITGCDGSPLGDHFKSNCASLGVNTSGLDLLVRQSYRTRPANNPELEFQIMAAQLGSPWPESQQINRITSLIDRNPNDRFVYTAKDTDALWGLQLKPDQVLIRLQPDQFKVFANEIGTTYANVSPL